MPEPLVHVDHRVDPGFPGSMNGVTKRFGAFAGREVLRESDVVGAAVPPVPEDAHGQSGPLLKRAGRGEHLAGAAAVPYPERGFGGPVFHTAGFEAGFPGPGLLEGPDAVSLGRREPVTLEGAERNPVCRFVAVLPGRAPLGQVHNLEPRTVFGASKHTEALRERRRVVRTDEEARAVFSIQGNALQ